MNKWHCLTVLAPGVCLGLKEWTTFFVKIQVPKNSETNDCLQDYELNECDSRYEWLVSEGKRRDAWERKTELVEEEDRHQILWESLSSALGDSFRENEIAARKVDQAVIAHYI